MRVRNKSIPIRVTEKELEIIDRKAEKAKLSRTNYLISCALGKQITIIEDLKLFLSELKRIGNNLNQITTLARMGRISEVNLIETWEVFSQIYQEIHRLAREKGGKQWQSS